MDNLSKLAVKCLAVEAVAYGIIGIAFLGISHLVGKTWAIETLFSTAGLAILLIIYSALAHTAYIPLLRRGGKSVLGFYLLAKTFRLLLAILVLLVYVFAWGHDILTFAIILLVLYIVGLVVTTIFYTKAERNFSKKS